MASEDAVGGGRLRALLGERDFVFFLLARSTSLTATHMLSVAIGWHIYEMTGSFVALGLVGMFQFAPALAFFPLTGLVADRFDRRQVLAVCFLVQAGACLVFLRLAFLGGSDPWPYYATLVLYGAARAFLNPASRALLPNLVPLRLFPNAVAFNSSFSKLSTLVGPAAGGVLIAFVGGWVYAIMAGLFLLGAAATRGIGARARAGRRGAGGTAWAEVLGGVAYIRDKKVLLGAISLDLFAVLFGTILGILPVFARDILGIGPDGLGLMRAMPALGAFAVAAVLAQLPPLRPAGPLLFVSLVLYGLCIVAFGLSEIVWLSMLLLVLYGALDMVSICIRQTMAQVATPDEMRGRVGAVDSVFTNGSEELGNFRSGVMAAGFGPVGAVIFGGIATLAITALWWRLFPDLRRIDRIDRDIVAEPRPGP